MLVALRTGMNIENQQSGSSILPHSICLRAIGQSLEPIGVEIFTLTQENGSYTVKSKALTPSSMWIIRSRMLGQVGKAKNNTQVVELQGGDSWVCFYNATIAYLHEQGRQRRRTDDCQGTQMKISHLLRALG